MKKTNKLLEDAVTKTCDRRDSAMLGEIDVQQVLLALVEVQRVQREWLTGLSKQLNQLAEARVG